MKCFMNHLLSNSLIDATDFYDAYDTVDLQASFVYDKVATDALQTFTTA